jgi:Ca2+-binding EF-hand superfamily protein
MLDSGNKSEKVKPEHFEHVFTLIDESGDNQVSLEEFLKVFEVFELYKYEEGKSLIFEEKKMPSLSELSTATPKENIRRTIESVQYEFIVNALSVANILALTIREGGN